MGSISTYTFVDNFLLVQLIPSPENPTLQVHSKLPKVLLHVAFSWQVSVPPEHSSMSIQIKEFHIVNTIDIIHACHGKCNPYLEHTCAVESISSESNVTTAGVTSNCVCASCIWITNIQLSFTLWNICNKSQIVTQQEHNNVCMQE